mgnify:CR=1 FL=1
MKKIISFIIAAVFAVGSAFAANDLLDFEGVAGMNIANVDETGCNSRIGFHVGVRGTYAFQSQDNGLYANGAALFSLLGTKGGSTTYNPYYLVFPIHMGYKRTIVEDVAVFGEFGPYFSVGLFGSANGQNLFSDDGWDFNRFDVGLGLRFGFEFAKKCSVSFGYDFGMVDVGNGYSAKNRNATISVGYKF